MLREEDVDFTLRLRLKASALGFDFRSGDIPSPVNAWVRSIRSNQDLDPRQSKKNGSIGSFEKDKVQIATSLSLRSGSWQEQ